MLRARKLMRLKFEMDWCRHAVQRQIQSQTFNLQSLPKAIERLSSSIGDIDWHVDPDNLDLVMQTVQSVGERFFMCHLEKHERMRFLGGAHISCWYTNLRRFQGDVWSVDARQLLLMRKLGIITRLPKVAKDELDDRNKADIVIKTIAITQLVYFILQLGARIHRRLPTSQLEIMTLSFALCTAVTYCLVLDKPKDVQYALTITAARRPRTVREMSRLAIVGPATYGPLWARYSFVTSDLAVHIDLDFSKRPGAYFMVLMSGASIAVFTIGLTHCIAWNFVFPSHVERILWQVSSIVTAAAPIVGFSISKITGMLKGRRRRKGELPSKLRYLRLWMLEIIAWVLYTAFFVARAFILIEVFRSLAFLPPGAYLTSWPANLPHLG